jgi:hypothetical protein
MRAISISTALEASASALKLASLGASRETVCGTVIGVDGAVTVGIGPVTCVGGTAVGSPPAPDIRSAAVWWGIDSWAYGWSLLLHPAASTAAARTGTTARTGFFIAFTLSDGV